jgi:hypothetical protein
VRGQDAGRIAREIATLAESILDTKEPCAG